MQKVLSNRLVVYRSLIRREEREQKLKLRRKEELKFYKKAKDIGIDDIYLEVADDYLRATPEQIFSWSQERSLQYG